MTVKITFFSCSIPTWVSVITVYNCWVAWQFEQLLVSARNKHIECTREKPCCAHQFRLLYHKEINLILRCHNYLWLLFLPVNLQLNSCLQQPPKIQPKAWISTMNVGSLQSGENMSTGKTSCMFIGKKVSASRPWKLAGVLWDYYKSFTPRVTSNELFLILPGLSSGKNCFSWQCVYFLIIILLLKLEKPLIKVTEPFIWKADWKQLSGSSV